MSLNLKQGDWVLLQKADTDLSQYLDGMWVQFYKYTAYGNIQVFVPTAHSVKVMKRSSDPNHPWVRRVYRKIDPQNIAAVAKGEKNPTLLIKTTVPYN